MLGYKAAEGEDKHRAEGRPKDGLTASFTSGLAGEYREGQRTSKGDTLERKEGRKGSSFPVGAKKLQEEGEDVDDV